MEKYILNFTGKEEIAEKTYSFMFKKPENFMFKAGQYMTFFLGNDSHDFSIASSPHEDYVMIATRIRGSVFKNKLMELSEGNDVEVHAPAGSFTLPKEKDLPVCYIAGGIGITPVRSMVKFEENGGSQRHVMLLYSNRRPEDSAFLHEMESVSLRNYRFIPTMTNISESISEWNGETGYIDGTMLAKYIDDLSLPVFYIVGPPTFVSAINDLLTSIEQIPSTHIKAEDFAGY